jgi:hypothetical protein
MKSLVDDIDLFTDFGFTAVSEDELESIQNAESNVSDLQTKLDKLYAAIIPLLNNLKQNPDKDYIFWPDRVSKVELFEKHIEKIIKS